MHVYSIITIYVFNRCVRINWRSASHVRSAQTRRSSSPDPKSANELMESKGALPGAFMVQLKRSRRNSKDVTLDTDIVNKIKMCCRGLDIIPPTGRIAVCINSGVKLNGRFMAHGDVCVWCLEFGGRTLGARLTVRRARCLLSTRLHVAIKRRCLLKC